MRTRDADRRLVCPVCQMTYQRYPLSDCPKWWKLGGKCGDLSNGQHRPCVGRLMPLEDWIRAEWRRTS